MAYQNWNCPECCWRQVCFKELDNFGCGILWGIGFLSTPGLLSCNGTFAMLSMPLHFSCTTMKIIFATPSALTLSLISSHTWLLFLFGSVVENLLLIMFSSASSRITTLGRCKVWFSGALCYGRGNIFCRVVLSLACASKKITLCLGYHLGNYLDSKLSIG